MTAGQRDNAHRSVSAGTHQRGSSLSTHTKARAGQCNSLYSTG